MYNTLQAYLLQSSSTGHGQCTESRVLYSLQYCNVLVYEYEYCARARSCGVREPGGRHRAPAGVAPDRLRVLRRAQLPGARERAQRAHRHGHQHVRHVLLRSGHLVHAARPLRPRGICQHFRAGTYSKLHYLLC